MTGDEETHEAAQKLLAALLVGEERIPVDEVEFAFGWVREASGEFLGLRRIQQQQLIEPPLDGILGCIPDRVLHGVLLEEAGGSIRDARLILRFVGLLNILLSESLNQLQGKG